MLQHQEARDIFLEYSQLGFGHMGVMIALDNALESIDAGYAWIQSVYENLHMYLEVYGEEIEKQP